MNATQIKKVNENHAIVSFHKSTEQFSTTMYVNALKGMGFTISKKYQKGNEVFVEMIKN
jgi:hypothetical protein